MKARSGYPLLAVAGAAIVIAGFVMPWVRIDADQPDRFQHILSDVGRITVVVGEGSEQISITPETLKQFPLKFTGHELPRLAKRSDARLALLLLAAATELPEDLPKRLAGLYAIPIGALFFGWLLLWVRSRWVRSLMAACSLVIAMLAAWILITVHPEVTLLKIRFEAGPWVAACGFLVLALVALLPSKVDRPSAKPL